MRLQSLLEAIPVPSTGIELREVDRTFNEQVAFEGVDSIAAEFDPAHSLE